eukprot:6390549-Pyramimonas_sp.AAC.1
MNRPSFEAKPTPSDRLSPPSGPYRACYSAVRNSTCILYIREKDADLVAVGQDAKLVVNEGVRRADLPRLEGGGVGAFRAQSGGREDDEEH